VQAAWRQTRATLAGLPKERHEEEVIAKLDALIANAQRGLGHDAGTKAVEAAASTMCTDDKGAWGAGPCAKPEVPSGKRGVRGILVELQRMRTTEK